MNSILESPDGMIRKGYNRLALIYDFLARIVFFNRINRSQIALLPYIPDFKACLIAGGGSGYFLEKLLSQKPEGKILYIDLSDKMIELARKRINTVIPSELHRVEFRGQCLEESWTEDHFFDLIVFNYFLDLFPDKKVEEIFKKCTLQMNTDSVLYITDFSIPVSNIVCMFLSSSLMKLLYCFFKLTTSIEVNRLPDIEFLLKKNKFDCFRYTSFWCGMMVSAIYKKRHPLTS